MRLKELGGLSNIGFVKLGAARTVTGREDESTRGEAGANTSNAGGGSAVAPGKSASRRQLPRAIKASVAEGASMSEAFAARAAAARQRTATVVAARTANTTAQPGRTMPSGGRLTIDRGGQSSASSGGGTVTTSRTVGDREGLQRFGADRTSVPNSTTSMTEQPPKPTDTAKQPDTIQPQASHDSTTGGGNTDPSLWQTGGSGGGGGGGGGGGEALPVTIPKEAQADDLVLTEDPVKKDVSTAKAAGAAASTGTPWLKYGVFIIGTLGAAYIVKKKFMGERA